MKGSVKVNINIVIFKKNDKYYLALNSEAYIEKDHDIQFRAFESIKEGCMCFALSIAGEIENKLGGLCCYQIFECSIVEYENTKKFTETLFNKDRHSEVTVQVLGNKGDYVVGMKIPDQAIGKSEWERGEHIVVRHINVSELMKNMDNDNCSSGGVGSSETLH